MIIKRLGEEFFSSVDKKKRSTVLFIKKDLNPQKIFADKQGRFIAVDHLSGKKILVVNIYAPNGVKNIFLRTAKTCCFNKL